MTSRTIESRIQPTGTTFIECYEVESLVLGVRFNTAQTLEIEVFTAGAGVVGSDAYFINIAAGQLTMINISRIADNAIGPVSGVGAIGLPNLISITPSATLLDNFLWLNLI